MNRLTRYALVGFMLVMALLPGVALGQALPDLAPTQILTTTVYQGVANSITVLVGNSGATDISAFNNPDFNVTLAANGAPVGGQIVQSSQPWGWPAYAYFSWTPPAAGSYTLLATADSSGRINESNETNNTYSIQVQVLPLAPVTVNVRVEGMTSTIFNGPVTFLTSTITDDLGDPYNLDRPTALGALNAASIAGGFPYVVSSTYGPISYLTSIDGEGPSGQNGWNYRVDWFSPQVGAADYSLGPNNVEVLWYYGSWSAQPIRLTADKASMSQGDSVTVTAEYYDDFAASWNPLVSGNVHAGGQNFPTDASGHVTFSLPAGSYQMYADKGGYAQYTRSNPVPLLVRPLGDVDGDGHIGLTDLVLVASAYGSLPGSPRYNADADVNHDGLINLFDLVIVGLRYGL